MATINLSREYTLAIQTNSYNEIWDKIHHHQSPAPQGSDDPENDSIRIDAARILQPDRASIEEALQGAPCNELTHLVSCYLDSSERTSLLCFSLRCAIDRSRSLYAPIVDLLDILPTPNSNSSNDSVVVLLNQPQCDYAFDAFLRFDTTKNPFSSFPLIPPLSTNSTSTAGEEGGFQGMRRCFVQLKQQLDLRLLNARQRLHAGGCCFFCSRSSASMELLQEHMFQLDAAARGTYALNNDLDTIERLVIRLHSTVESDKMLVRLGLASGRGQRHAIEEVVRQLRKNHPSLHHQLTDLDEHICLYFAAVNRARSLLIHHIYDAHPCHGST